MINIIYRNPKKIMSYTNVVFKQNITKNVNRDQIEHDRLDDRGTCMMIS